jgi:hypothetical protein
MAGNWRRNVRRKAEAAAVEVLAETMMLPITAKLGHAMTSETIGGISRRRTSRSVFSKLPLVTARGMISLARISGEVESIFNEFHKLL